MLLKIQLNPLKVVEKHIKENGLLLYITTANEVVKKGLNLREIDIKLLEKIGELTFYNMDLNKKNKILNDQIQQQQQLMDKLLQKMNN